jgi:hypothetical protein
MTCTIFALIVLALIVLTWLGWAWNRMNEH